VFMTKAVPKSASRAQVKFGFLAATLILTCLMSPAFAQTAQFDRTGDGDAYYIGYFGNANLAGFPDSQLNIVNTGSTGGYSILDFKTPVGDLCANIYVFKADQEMVECCSCYTTPNGQIQLSTNVDLTSNPLQNTATVPAPVAGVIKIVSSDSFSGGTCIQSASAGGVTSLLPVAATSYSPDGSLRSWNTHSRKTTASLYTVTEIPFRPARLDSHGSELSKLQAQCFFIWNTGSGKGRCTCGTEPN
jgi:hypothetical protein